MAQYSQMHSDYVASSPTADIVERLRKMAVCVYIAVETPVADDLSDGLRKAADEIERLRFERDELYKDRAQSALEIERLRSTVVAGNRECTYEQRLLITHPRAVPHPMLLGMTGQWCHTHGWDCPSLLREQVETRAPAGSPGDDVANTPNPA